MKITSGELLINQLKEVMYWVKEFNSVLDDSYVSDGTLSQEQYKALCIKKMENHKDACLYLDTFPRDYVMHSGTGHGDEYSKYLSIVNR